MDLLGVLYEVPAKSVLSDLIPHLRANVWTCLWQPLICYMTLCSHLWICHYYLLIPLSCGIYRNCVKHNFSVGDLEGNVITEEQDSYNIQCHICLFLSVHFCGKLWC